MHTLFQSLIVILPAFRGIFSAVGVAAVAVCVLASLGRMSIWLRGQDKDSEAEATSASTLVIDCPACFEGLHLAMQGFDSRLQIKDLMQVAAELL